MEDEIRAWAHKRNNADRGKVPHHEAFLDKVTGYIDSIPLDPAKLKHCPACEGALCEVCGGCHEVDHEFIGFAGEDCPVAVPNEGKPECVAWTYAYIYLKRGADVARSKA